MLQLADCGLEGLKALQACNRIWEGVPLYYCEGEERLMHQIVFSIGLSYIH